MQSPELSRAVVDALGLDADELDVIGVATLATAAETPTMGVSQAAPKP